MDRHEQSHECVTRQILASSLLILSTNNEQIIFPEYNSIVKTSINHVCVNTEHECTGWPKK